MAATLNEWVYTGTLNDIFPDGVFFHDFYGQPSTDVALHKLARSFGEKLSEETTPRDAAYLALRGRQALLVLDGAEEADNLDKILTIQRDCGVLIVTRYRYICRGTTVEVGVLPPNEAITVLRDWSNESQTNSSFQVWGNNHEANIETARDICELLGCLPLALRLAGRHMVSASVRAPEFLQRLQASDLSLLEEEKRQHHSVPFLLEKGLEKVSQTAQTVLKIVGILSYNLFDRQVLTAALNEIPRIELDQALDQLIKFSFLKRTTVALDRYHVVHRLIHTFAHNLARLSLGPSLPLEIPSQIASYFTNLVRTNHKATSYSIVESEHRHIMSIMAVCKEKEQWDAVKGLVLAIDKYLDLQGYWTDRLKSLQAALDAAHNLHDGHLEEDLLGRIGRTHLSLGHYDDAIDYIEQALSIASSMGFERDKSTHLMNLGNIYFRKGDYPKSFEYLQQALSLAQEIGHQDNLANCFGYLGKLYLRLGKYPEAREHYNGAIAIVQTDDPIAQAQWVGDLGSVWFREGEFELAIDHYEQALKISQKSGDRQREGICLGNIGEALSRLELYPQALDYLKQALAIAQRIGDRLNEANWLTNLGSIYRGQGDLSSAVEYYTQALHLFEDMGDVNGQARVLGFLARAYTSSGDNGLAIQLYEQAVKLEPTSPSLHNNLAARYLDAGRIREAKTHYEKRITLLPDDAFSAHVSLGVIELCEGKPAEAQITFQKALDLLDTATQRRLQTSASFLEDKAIAFLGLGKSQEAVETLKEALSRRQPRDRINFTPYNLLANIPNPLQGLAEMRVLLEEAAQPGTGQEASI